MELDMQNDFSLLSENNVHFRESENSTNFN